MRRPGNTRISPEYVLLGFLYRSSSHGYELHQRLSDKFGNIWHSSQSQTYNILKRLEVQEYITAVVVEQERFPPRQQLQITTSGSKRFEAWLAQPTKPSVHAIRVEFITRLYFTQQYYPERSQDMILAQVQVVKASLIRLKKQLATLSDTQIYDRLALELRIKLMSSVLEWMKECTPIRKNMLSPEDIDE